MTPEELKKYFEVAGDSVSEIISKLEGPTKYGFDILVKGLTIEAWTSVGISIIFLLIGIAIMNFSLGLTKNYEYSTSVWDELGSGVPFLISIVVTVVSGAFFMTNLCNAILVTMAPEFYVIKYLLK